MTFDPLSFDRKFRMRIERAFRCFTLCFFILFVAMLILMFFLGNEEPEKLIYKDDEIVQESLQKSDSVSKEPKTRDPIIIWWTDGSEQTDEYRKCGDVRCFVTGNRSYVNNPQTKVFMFYGTSFTYDDLPLPRKSHHEWALLHDESPTNNFLFSFEEVMTLFNHTSTFRRESDYPLVTQFLKSSEWLSSTKHLRSVQEKRQFAEKLELSPVMFANSDCSTGSDRDGFVQLLMEHVPVDSYGLCLHNRDLPEKLRDPLENMLHEDFFELIAKYKFAIAIENALCDDYVTEKFWRPLHVGTIPIVLGSPKIKDLLPSNKSAIIVDDYESVEDIAKYIKYLDSNDEEYEKYFEWKKSGISNEYLLKLLRERDWEFDYTNDYTGINFFEGFECFICRRVHENLKREKSGKEQLHFHAKLEHYGCPPPVKVDNTGKRTLESEIFKDIFTEQKYIAKSLRYYIDRNLTVDGDKVRKIAEETMKYLRFINKE